MKRGTIGGIAALILGLTAAPVRAQTTVERAAEILNAPVAGHPEVRTPPVRDVIVIERIHVPKRHAHGWWKRHGYRTVTVYYDGHRYYARRVARPGLRAIIVYHSKGRYYLGAEHDDRDRHGHDGDHEDDKD
jgi:hypothetical protein